MIVLCSDHLSDVMMISQAFTTISSRITGTAHNMKFLIYDDNNFRFIV